MPCWIIGGLTFVNFLLTIGQNCYMNQIHIKTNIGFKDFINSDVPLSKKDMYDEAIKDHNEDYDNLLAEEKFGIFVNKNLNKKKFKVLKKHRIEIDVAKDLAWEGLERQPNFGLMKLLSIVYMIFAQGINSYIYIFMIVGFTKFGLNTYEYEIPLTVILVIALKLQPLVMKLSIMGYGSLFWLIASILGTVSYFLIAFSSSTNTVAGYIAVLLLPGMVFAIDIMSKYSLARYSATMPTYYTNTWYNVLNNISIFFGTGTLALVYYYNKNDTIVKGVIVDTNATKEFHYGMIYLGSVSAFTTFISGVLLCLAPKNNRALRNSDL